MSLANRTTGHRELRSLLRNLWHKYGLIVVGNIVFFALLYFVQYRPNSRDNRATELLTLAQREEAEQRLEAAETLYRKVLEGYEDCQAAGVANERLPKVLLLARQKRDTQPRLPASCTPTIKLRELLELRPSFYLAELLAGYYPEVQPAERERYFSVLDGYVSLALSRDRVPLSKLKHSTTFRAGELKQRYFSLKASVRFSPDWVYDDFKLKNDSFFVLHNAVINVTATQGKRSAQESVRVPELAVGAEVDVLELNVAKDGGALQVRVTISADEGKVSFERRL